MAGSWIIVTGWTGYGDEMVKQTANWLCNSNSQQACQHCMQRAIKEYEHAKDDWEDTFDRWDKFREEELEPLLEDAGLLDKFADLYDELVTDAFGMNCLKGELNKLQALKGQSPSVASSMDKPAENSSGRQASLSICPKPAGSSPQVSKSPKKKDDLQKEWEKYGYL